jgi:outer membrane immunogenic protein
MGDSKMKSRSTLAIAATLSALATVPVNAADLRRPAPVAAPVVYAYNWTGFYIGGHAGGGWSDRCLTLAIGGEACADGSGFLGGGQVGFNFQSGQFVFGVEFSGSIADINGDSTSGSLPNGWYYSSAGKSLLMLTGRVGYSVDRALFYITGGGAWARNSVDFYNGAGGVASVDFDRQGWTIGAGIEYAFSPNWSMAAQYNFVDLGSKDIFFPTPGVYASVSQDLHMATLRLNYRFGGGGPVVARY